MYQSKNTNKWKQLKKLSKMHINEMIEAVLSDSGIDKDVWLDILKKFVFQAVDSVKPSSRYLDDGMDFNSFVDIVILENKDEKKSQYINGCVFNKNLADRQMPNTVRNPKILLLKGSLGFMRDVEEWYDNKDKVIYTDINSVVNQEDIFFEILEEKILSIGPNVIITEKDISFKALEMLRKN